MNKYIDRIKRNIITIKLYLYRSGWKKAKYLRKKNHKAYYDLEGNLIYKG